MDNYDPTYKENNDAFDDADDDPRASTNGAGRNACIGRVGAPPQKEATSTNFYFWIPPDGLVAKTQLITCKSNIAPRNYTFYAIIAEVYRQSRQRAMAGEIDAADGGGNHQRP